MKETKVTKYETEDGKTFDSKDEALAHEARVKVAVMLTDFLAFEEIETQVSRARAINLINKWESFKAVQEAQFELKIAK